ncbi:MAG TPA: PRC-barrel domain-containing protein [Thermomicrobiales bacterium]|jgi:hypothetical protein
MAELTDRYLGIELYGADGERIGTVAGLLTADDLAQYYVVEHGGFLGFGKRRYYVPAERGVATGGRRLDTDATESQFGALGWDTPPVDPASVHRVAAP